MSIILFDSLQLNIITTRISSLTTNSGYGVIPDTNINITPVLEITDDSLRINANIQSITLSSILSGLETQIFDRQDRGELVTDY